VTGSEEYQDCHASTRSIGSLWDDVIEELSVYGVVVGIPVHTVKQEVRTFTPVSYNL